MERAIANRLVDDDIAVTDFNVVQARRVGANPCLILDGSSLATEIRQRNQITFTTLATPGKCILHEIASFLLTRDSIRLPAIRCRPGWREVSRGGASAAASASPQQSYVVSAAAMIPYFLSCVSRFSEEIFIKQRAALRRINEIALIVLLATATFLA